MRFADSCDQLTTSAFRLTSARYGEVIDPGGQVHILVSNAHNLVFSTGDPAYAVDRCGRIVAWNTAAERAFGFPHSAAVGVHCWELLQGRDMFGNLYCGERCPHRAMAERNKPINRCRMQFRLANGEYSNFLLSSLTLHAPSPQRVLVHLCRPDTAVPGRERHAGAGRDFHLTAREKEVLAHLAAGRSTPTIAASLNITIPTVRSHIEHILTKLGCHSRLEAVAVARKSRLS